MAVQTASKQSDGDYAVSEWSEIIEFCTAGEGGRTGAQQGREREMQRGKERGTERDTERYREREVQRERYREGDRGTEREALSGRVCNEQS